MKSTGKGVPEMAMRYSDRKKAAKLANYKQLREGRGTAVFESLAFQGCIQLSFP